MAVDVDPMNSVAHYTLGNVYAVLTQYNKSIESFDYALRLSNNLPWVEKRRAAVMVNIEFWWSFYNITNLFQCHRKLERTLENQHEKLQNKLDELRSYQTQHAEWTKMNNKLNNVQASLETKVWTLV